MKKTGLLSRRGFMSVAAAAGCGIVASAGDGLALSKKKAVTPVGLQLYTLRDLMKEDFAGTVAKVAEIGYDAVEFAGYGGLSASGVKRLLSDLGLVCAGSHEGFQNLGDRLGETIEFNAAIGNGDIVCPSMPQEWRERGADGFREFGERMTAIGEKVKAAGLRFAYHNHNFEFERAGGKHLIDYFFETADPDVVGMEVDVYWVKRGGVDPAAFIRRNAKRCTMIHMKDMADDTEQSFAPVGTGTLDMPGIVAASREAGARWYVVEQDRTKRPPLEAVAISLKNMRALLS